MSNARTTKTCPPRTSEADITACQKLHRRLVGHALAQDEDALAKALEEYAGRPGILGAAAGLLARDVACLVTLAAFAEVTRDFG